MSWIGPAMPPAVLAAALLVAVVISETEGSRFNRWLTTAWDALLGVVRRPFDWLFAPERPAPPTIPRPDYWHIAQLEHDLDQPLTPEWHESCSTCHPPPPGPPPFNPDPDLIMRATGFVPLGVVTGIETVDEQRQLAEQLGRKLLESKPMIVLPKGATYTPLPCQHEDTVEVDRFGGRSTRVCKHCGQWM